jgi:hypothetical protein
VRLARALDNEAAELLGLEDALARPGSGPLDVEPFLPPARRRVDDDDERLRDLE